MKRIYLFLFCACLFQNFAFAEIVKHVIDGDTVILENEQRVRLIGVDAPEVDHPRYNRVGEFFGEESRVFLKTKVEGRDIRVEGDQEPYDKYGRRLGYLFLDGENINQILIEEGYAEAMRRFPYRYKEQFLALEREAKAAGKGMWAGQKKVQLRPNFLKIPFGAIFILILVFPVGYRFFRNKFRRG